MTYNPVRARAAGEERRAQTATALRDKLRAADTEMELPEGLWERVRTGDTAADPLPSAAPVPPAASRASVPARLRAKRRGPLVLTAVAAGAVTLIATGAWWLASPGPASAPPAEEPGVELSVNNVESACHGKRTYNCALRVAADPHGRYAAPGNRAALVWHGQKLRAVCTVTDGTLVKDEAGTSSTSWYSVRTEGGTKGWLPAVRAGNVPEVPECSADRTATTPR